MKNDFTVADLTAIHTRLIFQSKAKLESAADEFKIVKERAKKEGVSFRDVKLALEYLNESEQDRDQRAAAIQRTLQALGQNIQLSFDFVRVADDWDKLRGQGRLAAIFGQPCEPPANIKGHDREMWVNGWTDFMKIFDAYQDVLDEQADADRKSAEDMSDNVTEFRAA